MISKIKEIIIILNVHEFFYEQLNNNFLPLKKFKKNFHEKLERTI